MCDDELIFSLAPASAIPTNNFSIKKSYLNQAIIFLTFYKRTDAIILLNNISRGLLC